MSAELERYKALCVAQEAEIARLQSGFEDLKVFIRNDMFINESYDQFNKIHNTALRNILREVNHITGAEN